METTLFSTTSTCRKFYDLVDRMLIEKLRERMKNFHQALQCVAQESMPEKYQDDREIILAAVKQNSVALTYACKNMQNDRGFVLEAVRQNGLALAFVDEQFKDDDEIVVAAVNQNDEAKEYASIRLRLSEVLNPPVYLVNSGNLNLEQLISRLNINDQPLEMSFGDLTVLQQRPPTCCALS